MSFQHSGQVESHSASHDSSRDDQAGIVVVQFMISSNASTSAVSKNVPSPLISHAHSNEQSYEVHS